MNPGFLNVVDAKENQNSIVEDNKTAHKEYLTEYGKFFYDMRDKLEMIGGYKIDVPFTYGTTTLSQSNRLSGIVGCDQKSVNIFLYETSYGTGYRLADIKVDDSDNVSIQLYPNIADFSPEYLKTALEETIRSTDEKFLTEHLRKANQESITDLRYAPKMLENASTISPELAKRIDRDLFVSDSDVAYEFGDKRTLAVCHGRLSIVQLKNLDNTDVLKDSQGNLIVYDTVEDAVQAAAVMTSYKNMNRDVQDKLAHMSHSFGAAQDVNNVTELADMISQGLSENKDFIDGLDDLKETELTR